MGELLKFDKKSCLTDELRMARVLSLPPNGVWADDPRWHVNHVLVRGEGSGVSTDGGRLHYVDRVTWDGEPVSAGWYKPVKLTKSACWWERRDTNEEHDFPNYDHLIEVPADEPSSTMTLNFSEDDQAYVYAMVVRAMQVSYINPTYLSQLCTVLDSGVLVRVWNTSVKVSYHSEKEMLHTEKPVRVDITFSNGSGGVALLMPIRGR